MKCGNHLLVVSTILKYFINIFFVCKGPGILQHQNKPGLFSSTSNSSSASSTGRGSSYSAAVHIYGGSRSNTPTSSHQSTPAVRHKK
jgi:hypothetical protein